jgi:PAS domain S-box-containing protein
MNTPPAVRAILAAAALTLISIGLEMALAAATGATVPLLALLAVAAAAAYGGIPCGLIATVLATLLTPLVLPPLGGFTISESTDLVRLTLLPLLGVGITLMVAYMRRTSETLAATLASIGDGVLVTDASGRVKSLNREAERLTGWTAEAARGRMVEEVFQIVNEHTRASVENPVRRVLREGTVVGLANHTLLVARDGTTRPIDDSGAPVRHHSGRIPEVVLVFRDDSARRAAAVQAEQFRTFVSATSDVVYRMSADWSEMRHLKGKEFIADTTQPSQTWLDTYIPRDDQAQVLAAIQNAIRTKSLFELEHRVIRVDGTLGWTFSRAIALFDNEGEIVEWLGAASDMTSRREAEEALRDRERRLEEANRVKDEFLATVSHELRTPLNAILGWTMLLRESPDPAQIERAVDKVDRNAKALRQIVEDLLDLSRTSRGELRMQRSALDMREVVKSAAEAIAVLAQQKRVSLVLDDAETCCIVLGDAMRLQQVTTNLLTNAIKFTPTGGHVTVRQRQEGAWIVLSVQDTGIGIRPDLLDAVFEPFRRLEAHGTLGLGLGLSIVRNVVEAHEGTVSAHSEGEGRGTTFIVKLPAALEGSSELLRV